MSDFHRQQQQAPSSRVNPRTATNGTQSNHQLNTHIHQPQRRSTHTQSSEQRHIKL
ncbi:MAG: hypothetical protein Q9221_002882 [Calogaya cf. arnoldii]